MFKFRCKVTTKNDIRKNDKEICYHKQFYTTKSITFAFNNNPFTNDKWDKPLFLNYIILMAEHTKDINKRIKALLAQGETSEVEFKSARGGFPASFWESYSAFANTNGGTIVLGVLEKGNRFFLDGLTEDTIVRYKKNFWDCAHNKGKISVCLPLRKHLPEKP